MSHVDKKLEKPAEEVSKFLHNSSHLLTKVDAKSQVIPVHTALASAYGGKKAGEDILKLDERMKVCIAATIIKMQELKNPSWDELLATMMQNPSVVANKDQPSPRAESYQNRDTNWFKYKKEVDKGVVAKVYDWWVKLIGDKDVLEDTKIDINFIQNVVAGAAARVDSFASFFYSHTYYERRLVDVGVLRYPDITNSYFKLYRISIGVWADTTRVIFYSEDVAGCNGEFRKQIFNARDEILSEIQASSRKKAVQELNDLFNNL